MKFEMRVDTLFVSELHKDTLHAGALTRFKEDVLKQFTPPLQNIEIDLTGSDFMDSSGVGALVALHKKARAAQGTVTLKGLSTRDLATLGTMQLLNHFQVTLTD